MADLQTIRVMISSRSMSRVFGSSTTLRECRTALKRDLEAQTLCGERLFEVWIHEDAPAAADNTWEKSLERIRWADIVLGLVSGEAGSVVSGQALGICQAELAEALASAPGKLRLLQLVPLVAGTGAEATRNQRFQAWFVAQRRMAPEVHSLEELLQQARTSLREAVGVLARAGVERLRGGHYDRGSALDWSRLDFAGRKQAMEEATRAALIQMGGQSHPSGIQSRIRDRTVLLVCHGIPAALSVPAAREMVGQPFLRDHLCSQAGKAAPDGPVHLVACHRGVTEAQALRLLGFPDATVVTTGFGVYVADGVQKIQLIFLARCRDPLATQARVEELLRWLDETEEAERLVQRARARRLIAAVIAQHAP